MSIKFCLPFQKGIGVLKNKQEVTKLAEILQAYQLPLNAFLWDLMHQGYASFFFCMHDTSRKNT